MDQVKFVGCSPERLWSDMVCFNKLYHLNVFKRCIPQILLSLFVISSIALRRKYLLFYRVIISLRNYFMKSCIFGGYFSIGNISNIFHTAWVSLEDRVQIQGRVELFLSGNLSRIFYLASSLLSDFLHDKVILLLMYYLWLSKYVAKNSNVCKKIWPKIVFFDILSTF